MVKRVAAVAVGGFGILSIVFGDGSSSYPAAQAIFAAASVVGVAIGWLYSRTVLGASLTWGEVTIWATVASTVVALGILVAAGGLDATGERGVLFTIRGFVSGLAFGLFLSLVNYGIRGPLSQESETQTSAESRE